MRHWHFYIASKVRLPSPDCSHVFRRTPGAGMARVCGVSHVSTSHRCSIRNICASALTTLLVASLSVTRTSATFELLEQVGNAASVARAVRMASDALGGVDNGGVFIKTMHGRGCLDSGCCTLFWRVLRQRPVWPTFTEQDGGAQQTTPRQHSTKKSQALRINARCPPWSWLKWSADGPLIVSQQPLSKMCLTCDNAEPGCVAQVSQCRGGLDQQWRLRFASNWTTEFGEPLFGITSFYAPQRCLTLVNGGGDGDFYALQSCARPQPSEWQAFYVVRSPLKP
ncbi:uncharacterized protein LOC144153248 isoform X1 [Haemaphysalis longicornis]